MERRNLIALFLCLILICLKSSVMLYGATKFNIISFGANPNGKTINTLIIQKVIDSAYANGGGTVVIPKGIFLSGSLHLKSKVNIYLEQGAVLLGSTKRTDYESRDYTAFVIARDADSITISGKGVIDGNGRELVKDIYRMIDAGLLKDPYYPKESSRPEERNRPELLQFQRCRNLIIKGITLKSAACWVNTYQDCVGVIIDSMTVESTAFWNNDGIDITDSKNVQVTNCKINSADDGICLKSVNQNSCCDNIIIENCIIRSSANALKFGTASSGGFKNIRAKKLYIYDTYRSAIALEQVDGGILENIDISDVIAKNTGNAIFIKLGNRNRDNTKQEPGTIRNIHISNIKVEIPINAPDSGYEMAGPKVMEPHNLIPSSIVGLPNNIIQNITIENVEIQFAGGAKKECAYIPLTALDSIPERPKNYPEFSMLGELPAWGFYIRHANGIKFKNISFLLKSPDFRPTMVFDDVNNLEIESVIIKPKQVNVPIILNNTHNAEIKNINAFGSFNHLVMQQNKSSDIKLSQ